MAVFQVVKTGLEKGLPEGYKAEAEGFAELGMTSESKALKSIFFGQVLLIIATREIIIS